MRPARALLSGSARLRDAADSIEEAMAHPQENLERWAPSSADRSGPAPPPRGTPIAMRFGNASGSAGAEDRGMDPPAVPRSLIKPRRLFLRACDGVCLNRPASLKIAELLFQFPRSSPQGFIGDRELSHFLGRASMLRRIWYMLVATYQFAAYFFLAVWFLQWQRTKSESLGGAPWWSYLLGPVLGILALVCTIRIRVEGEDT